MATAFHHFKSAKFNYKLSPAFYIFKTLIVLVLLSQTIIIINPNRCPNYLVQASPISTHLIDQIIINNNNRKATLNDNIEFNLSNSNLTRQEPTTINNTITNVIEKLAASSKNLTLNLTNSLINHIEPLFSIRHQHSVADNYDQFDFNSQTILQQFKVPFAIEIVLRIGIFIYCCLVIGYLCDEYFVPSLESIGEALNLRPDLIGAILIPLGTSGPEIFSSAVGVFFAENDIGTGAIIGSGVFNILAIPAASGLAASYFIGHSIKLDKGPVLRDLTFYFISIIVLILAIKDNAVDFIDSTLFTTLFVVYIGAMFYHHDDKFNNITDVNKADDDNNKSVQTSPNLANNIVKNNNNNNNCSPMFNQYHHLPKMTINNNLNSDLLNNNLPGRNKMKQYLNKCNEWIINEKEPLVQKVAKLYDIDNNSRTFVNEYLLNENNDHKEQLEQKLHLFIDDIINQQRIEEQISKVNKFDYEKIDSEMDSNGVGFTNHILLKALLMPFIFIFTLTMPNRFPQITFVFSIIWLSVLSYVTVWSVSGLSDMVGMPSTISGMTILAAGSAVPDLVTSIIVIKKTSQASIGICAAIASNIFAILLGLGLPWTIQFVLNWIRTDTYRLSLIQLQSTALPYTSILLLIIVMLLYFTLKICNWKISKKFSLICTVMHLIFVTVSIILELSIS